MSLDFSVRSPENEIMDDFELSGEILTQSLEQIALINRWLGGDRITRNGIKALLQDVQRPITIVDIGCGGGHMCRAVAKWASRSNKELKIIGVDANQTTIDYARQHSTKFDNISYHCANLFDPNFQLEAFDIAICTLTLHHFSEQEILQLLKTISQKAKLGIVINDLHRSRVAYMLFKALSNSARFNSMVKHDGCISILSGFKRKDLKQISQKLGFQNDTIHWRWAFRYQWIIPTA